MAKPISKIIETIKEELSQYKLSDDFPIDNEYLLDKCNDVRASMIRKEFNAGNVSMDFYSQICCLEVTCERYGCVINGEFIPSQTTLWSVEIPKLIDGIGWANLLYFGKDGLNRNFDRFNLIGWMNLEGNIATSTRPAYTIIGDTAYIKNAPTAGFKRVCIVGLVYNPVNICNYSEDTPYPVPSDITLQKLVKMDILATWPQRPDEKQDGRFPEYQQSGRQQQQQQQIQEEQE